MFTTLINKIKQMMQSLGLRYDNSTQKIEDLLNTFSQDEKSRRRWTITLSALGVVLFLILAAVLPFKDTLFNLLYPKPASRAGVCPGSSQVPATRAGFVYNGGDLSQETEVLGTSLYYTRDLSLGPKKKIFLIGKYVGGGGGPLGLNTLMGDNLSNFEFQGAGGQPPAGWKFLTAGRSGEAVIETARLNVFSGQTSVKITNHKSPFGTQLAQSFKRQVAEGDLVIFGSWVKTLNPAGVKILLQNDASPFEDIGQISTAAVAGQWNFVLGYAKIPPKVTSFQLVLRVASQESEAWFDAPVVAVIDAKANTQITKLVSERCGSAWFVGNEPGKESSSGSIVMAPVTAEIYALIYRQFYQAIKEIDPGALVLPGGFAGPPSSFDGQGGYSFKSFLDGWRTAYKNFFGDEPPLDAMNLHYFATNSNSWSDPSDLENYLQKVHSYMKEVPGWGGKPIWLSELGVASSAPNAGVDFAKSAVQFLAGNSLDIAKWFWFDTCGYNPGLAPLFESNNRICTWPVKPTLLGKIYRALMPTPTPTSTPIPLSSPIASASARPQVLVQPLGLSAVNPFEDVQRTGQPFNENTYQNPSISGVTFRTSWQDLESENGKYNFKIIIAKT